MKKLPMIASVLLGLCFLAASLPVLLNLMAMPKLPEGTPAAHFMAAFMPTGYMKFVKWFEFFGALMAFVPRLRNLALLILGPIIVNIIGYTVFVDNPAHLLNPLFIIVLACALYLLWDARRKFANLLN
ncbi:MAG: hypothetical protein ACLQVY_03105 [Limisphaerales bacterium]